MEKQTSVEWLYERLERMIPRTPLYNIDKEQYFKEANAMFEQQIMDAWEDGKDSFSTRSVEQYYNEQYKK